MVLLPSLSFDYFVRLKIQIVETTKITHGGRVKVFPGYENQNHVGYIPSTRKVNVLLDPLNTGLHHADTTLGATKAPRCQGETYASGPWGGRRL